MKAAEIQVGKLYLAKVSGKVVPVRVDDVRHVYTGKGSGKFVYDVTNTVTNRKTTFRSAAKFRGAVPETTAEAVAIIKEYI